MRKLIKKIIKEDELDWIRNIDPTNFYDENSVPNNREKVYYETLLIKLFGDDFKTVLEDEYGLFNPSAEDFFLYENYLEDSGLGYDYLYDEISESNLDNNYTTLNKYYERSDGKFFKMSIIESMDGSQFDEVFLIEVFPVMRVKFV
jgi:hypothetical protein